MTFFSQFELSFLTDFCSGPSNRSNSVSSLDLEGESVSELGAGPSGSNGVEALQLLEHEQGMVGLLKVSAHVKFRCTPSQAF